MLSGCKENAMTIACERSKRGFSALDFGEETGASAKKLRVLQQSAFNHQHSPAAAVPPGGSPLNNEGSESGKVPQKKRSRQPETDNGVSVSLPFTGKKGKRADGGSSNSSAVSPRAAAAAIQAQMTCEGLEKDTDLEAEQAYISRRHQQLQQGTQQRAAATPAAGATAGARSSAAWDADSDVGAVSPARDRDAARSGRRRDQALHSMRDGPHSGSRRREVQGPSSSSGPEQAADSESPSCALEEHIHLDLLPDKEWQRLFAVLTISKRADEQPQQQCQQQGAFGGSAGAGGGSSSAAFGMAGGMAPAAAAAAPRTPTRAEGSGQALTQGELTPTRRSFLSTEFCRVQARHQAGIGRATPAAAAQAGL